MTICAICHVDELLAKRLLPWRRELGCSRSAAFYNTMPGNTALCQLFGRAIKKGPKIHFCLSDKND